jgi:hypothetical protein
MASKRKFPGTAAVILLSVALTLAVTACPTDSDGGGGGGARTVLEGTWEGPGSQRVTFSGNSFTRITGSTLDLRGTFTLSSDGETIDFAINRYSTDGGSNWLNRNQYIDARIIAQLEITEALWNSYPEAQKQQLRETYAVIIGAPASDTGTYSLILDGNQLIIVYSGSGTVSSRTVMYQKEGFSAVSSELLGKWANKGAPSVLELDFTTSQLQRRRNATTMDTYYTLETDGKIEIGAEPGKFTQDFCQSYAITGGELTFTGGQSNTWYSSVTFVKYVFTPPPATSLAADQWTDGEITNASGGEVWYSFSVTRGTTYRVWWNDGNTSNSGDGTKTLDVRVTGYYDNGSIISTLNNVDYGYGTASSFSASSSGTVYLKVTPYYSGNIGTFGIVYSNGTTRPVKPIQLPSQTTTLIADQWENGEITSASGGVVWYSFSVTSGTTYRIWWNDGNTSTSGDGTKTLDIRVSGYNSDGIIFSTLDNIDAGWDTVRSFTATSSGTVYIRVTPYYSGRTGTFGIVYSTGTARPNIPIDFPANPTALTADLWANGEITGASGGEVWYSFTVTSGTAYRIWWNDDYSNSGNYTKTLDVRVNAWYSTGASIFTSVDSGWDTAQSFTPSSSGTVYVRVYPKTSGTTGTFGIVYSTSTTRPNAPFDTPSGVTALTAGTWSDGQLTTGQGEAWYSFAVTCGTTYRIWWNDSNSGNFAKTLDVRVSAWYGNTGASIFYNTDSGWSTAQSFTPNASQAGTVYIKVSPRYVDYTGTFGITYTTINTRPDAPFNPPSPITLIENQWADDGITSGSGGEVWYSFVAASGTTYRVWLNDATSYQGGDGTKTLDVLVSAWYGNTGDNIALNRDSAWSSPLSLTPDANQAGTVYIRVRPYNSGNTGTFGIIYSTGSTRPFNPSATSLTAGQWANGNITTPGGQEWFMFTATAATQYIHVIFGTLDDFYVEVYDSTGTQVGYRSGMYTSTTSADRSLTSGQSYYIKVYPYSSSRSGTYRITFNASSTAPPQ